MNIQLVRPEKRRKNFILPLFEGEEILMRVRRQLSVKDRNFLIAALKRERIRGEMAKLFVLPSSHNKVLVLGKGKKAQWNARKARLLIRRAVGQLKTHGMKEASLDAVAVLADDDMPALLELISSEFLIADFTFTDYKETPRGGWPLITRISIAIEYAPAEKAAMERAIENGIIIGEETNHARRLANTPGGDMTPEILAAEAKKAAKKTKLGTTVIGEKQMQKLGMGGILGVSRGSAAKPQFIILEHKPKNYGGKPLVLVGKGVTFDTGGLNLKPEKSIHEMHLDMSGGAAVIHALAAISRLDISLHVVGLIPAVENMPSGSSYRPGDILKSITGKTIEVLNTDAEGRIILADALGYARRYNPRFVVDIATLTGAAAVALGQRASALFTKEEKDEALFRALGETSGDYLWPLPLWNEYAEDIRGTFGDIANVGRTESYGGAITAAMFLKQFTSYPWAHIDIAPTMTTIESDKLARGAKGAGTRLLIALARHLAKNII